MIYLQLFFEFFKIGLFAVGGGLATIPFLMDLGSRTGWFTAAELADMIAVSESTPGPMGVNMATYVGCATAGIPGGVLATLGLACPSLIIILLVAQFLKRFKESKRVEAVLYGLKAASVALITVAMLQVARIALIRESVMPGASGMSYSPAWPAVILAAAVFAAAKFTPLKKLHPIVFIAFSAIIGIALNM